MFIGGTVIPASAYQESPAWIPASSPPPSSWWTAGGATGVIAAYQFKGAASYAASKVNLANPGTHDATDTTAPTWNSTDGVIFNGSTQFLITDIAPASNYTALIQATDVTATNVLFGARNSSAPFGWFRLYADSGGAAYYANGDQVPKSPGFSSGNIGIVGLAGYRDGAFDVTITGLGFIPNLGAVFYVGGEWDGGSVGEPAAFKCQAFVIYDNTLDATTVAAVAAAMAAI